MSEQVTEPGGTLAVPVGDGSDRSLFSTSTLGELRDLLAAVANLQPQEERIRSSAAAVVKDARRGDVRVEEMLIRLKAEWMPLIDEQGLTWTQCVRDLTSRLVTQCITTYYAPPPGDGAHGAP